MTTEGRPATTFQKVGFIYNPKANKGQCEKLFNSTILPLIHKHFGERFYKALPTLKQGGAIDRAIELCGEGVDLIVSCGGDGTLHEVINGVKRVEEKFMSNGVGGSEKNVMESEDNTDVKQISSDDNNNSTEETSKIVPPAIGIITLGTSDDFASHIKLIDKTLKYEQQYERMIEIISKSGRALKIDLGIVEATAIEYEPVIHRKIGQKNRVYFVNIASFGSDANVTHKLNTAKNLWNKKLYNYCQILIQQLTYVNKKTRFYIRDHQLLTSDGQSKEEQSNSSTTTTITTTTTTTTTDEQQEQEQKQSESTTTTDVDEQQEQQQQQKSDTIADEQKSSEQKQKVKEAVVQVVIVGNGTTYGNGLKVCPDANIRDGYFHVTEFGDVGMMDAISLLPKVGSGSHTDHSKISVYKCKGMKAEQCGEHEKELVLVEADGEIVGSVPVQFDIAPSSIELIVPVEYYQQS